MIKTLFGLAFVTVTVVACVNSEKLLTAGQYDQAMDAAMNKVKKGGKDADEQALILETAYKKAQQQDKDRIEYYKKEDNPANWDDIYYTYVRMNNRQEKVKPILPLKIKSKKRDAEIEIIDYSSDLINSKTKAVEYFYNHALQLLEKNNRADARNAYEDLKIAKGLNSEYKDINDQLKKALALGTTYVLYKIENKSGMPLPPGFEEEQLRLPFAELNKTWLQYDSKTVPNRKYDYTVSMIIKTIEVGPDVVTKNDYIESKQVDDGFSYVLDDKGNVKKDATGNDMKTPKYKNISCQIIETHQKKKAIINTMLDYTDNTSNQLIRSEPLMSESVFENHTAMASGDMNALKLETKNKLGSNPVPFPNALDMVLKASQPLKVNAQTIIWKNKDLLN